MFASPSSAEWVLVQETKEAKSYVDADRIRDHKGYVYIWELLDLGKPNEHGVSSIMSYTVCDCDLFRYGPLHFSVYEKAMGKGEGKSINVEKHKWTFPPPKSRGETFLNIVCKIASTKQASNKTY